MGPQVYSVLSILLYHIGTVNYGSVHALCSLTVDSSGTKNRYRVPPSSNNSSEYVDKCLNPSFVRCVWDGGQKRVYCSQRHKWRQTNKNDSVPIIHFGLDSHPPCATPWRRSIYTGHTEWSPANVELFQAVAKISILVLLKIIIKYYIKGYLKAHITSKIVFEIIDLGSKALTIAIAKCAIKWAIYPAMRTAAKTFLIASLKSLLKPFTVRFIKGSKCEFVSVLATLVKFTLALSVKVVIKIMALEILVVVFENEATQLSLYQLFFRVSMILLVKMSAKRVCKWGKQKSIQRKYAAVRTVVTDETIESVAPVDKILMFAIQKLVTKLVKIPVIKMLL